MALLENMNEKQREAILKTDGALLILAGAGSGKTRVLTHKIAYLIKELGIEPTNILALTFTNKAAGEIKDRIESLVETESRYMWAGTFHSICVRILRRDIEKIGYKSNFVIYDTTDQKTLVKDCIKELMLNEKNYNIFSQLSYMSRLKDQMITPEENMNMTSKEDYYAHSQAKIYSLYQKKLKQNNALDFDDLIVKTIELFEENPEIRDYYAEKFQYVLVDEYQDTSRSQYRLINHLSSYHRNICVVGDADQSIYGWRGADIRNILDFEKDYPEAEVILLEQNYRSTKTILNAANAVIKNNEERKDKNLWTDNPEGEKITVYRAQDEKDEARYVAEKIKENMMTDMRDYKDFAVLYRMNAQSRVIEEEFMSRNIKYTIVGGLKFYERKELKDIIAYLRVIQNPEDDISIKRIVNVPKRGIGKTTLDKIEDYSLSKGISFYNGLYEAEEAGVSTRAVKNIEKFNTLIGTLIAMKEIFSLEDFVIKLIDSIKYIDELEQDGSVEARSRIENIQEFLSVIKERTADNPDMTLEDFLAEMSLLSDLDKTDESEADTVTMMTMHSAKGLEYPYVFIVGMEESIFPSYRSIMEDNLEEERRLCYVAITRAEKKLYITNAAKRTLFGKQSWNSESEFLSEIPDKYIEKEGSGLSNEWAASYETGKSGSRGRTGRGLFTGGFDIKKPEKVKASGSAETFSAGDKVKHDTLGTGTVINTSGSGDKTQVTVAFEGKGVKNLLIAYAPLKKI